MLFIAPAVAGLSSCNGLINDDLDPCPEGLELRFIYDYNMEFANAFPAQVHCLTLFVYDEDGRYLQTITETSRDRLSDEDYRMTIDLPEGRYSLVAYGGMACPDASYHFVDTPAEGSMLTSLSVGLNQSIMQSPTGTDLHSLFYGRIEAEVKRETMDYEKYTLPMMKDTNNLRIVLQELSGETVDDKDFDFKVIDDNTLMAWNNTVIPTSPFSYLTWAQGQVGVGINPSDGTEVKNAFAEFSFGRLIDPHAENPEIFDPARAGATPFSPRLLVTRRSDGSAVIDYPLINLLVMMKSQKYSKMPDQEYLDRRSDWSLAFILDSHWTWVAVEIVVDDWVVRINTTDL